jgi:hypothetical protein
MKPIFYIVLLFATGISLLSAPGPAWADERVAPFGFGIGTFNYDETLQHLSEKGWKFVEYEKKQFKEIDRTSPRRGENTFLKIMDHNLSGVKSILLFFGPQSVLRAILINLEPQLFAVTMADLGSKYRIIQKNLDGEFYSSDYPHILYEKNDVTIELQMYSPHRVRLLYVESLVWEKYRNFLQKVYEPHRNQENRKAWMKDL